MKQQTPDLTQRFPRSPKEKIDGIVHFARIIDKAQAKGAGLIGEYIYPCPLDEIFLGFFEIEADDFFQAVQGKNDEEVATWLEAHGAQRSNEEISAWSDTFLKKKPADAKEKRHFIAQRDRLAPGRTEIETWVDLLDLDEGRDLQKNT